MERRLLESSFSFSFRAFKKGETTGMLFFYLFRFSRLPRKAESRRQPERRSPSTTTAKPSRQRRGCSEGERQMDRSKQTNEKRKAFKIKKGAELSAAIKEKTQEPKSIRNNKKKKKKEKSHRITTRTKKEEKEGARSGLYQQRTTWKKKVKWATRSKRKKKKMLNQN